MHPDLMRAARFRPGTQNGKPAILLKVQPLFNVQARYCGCAKGMNRPLKPNC